MAKTFFYQRSFTPQPPLPYSAWGWMQQTPALPVTNRCKPKSDGFTPTPATTLDPAVAQAWGWQQQTPPLPITNRCRPKGDTAIPIFPYAGNSSPNWGFAVESQTPPKRQSKGLSDGFTPSYPYVTPPQPPNEWAIESLPALNRRQSAQQLRSEAIPLYPYTQAGVPTPAGGWVAECSPVPIRRYPSRLFTNVHFTPVYPYATSFVFVPWGWTTTSEIPAVRKRIDAATIEVRPQGLPALPPMGWTFESCVPIRRPQPERGYSVTPEPATTPNPTITQAWGWTFDTAHLPKRPTPRLPLRTEETRPNPPPVQGTIWGHTFEQVQPPPRRRVTSKIEGVTPIYPAVTPSGFVSESGMIPKKQQRQIREETKAWPPLFTIGQTWGWVQIVDAVPPVLRRRPSPTFESVAFPPVQTPSGFAVISQHVATTRRFIPEKATVFTPSYQWVFVPSGWLNCNEIKLNVRKPPILYEGWCPPAAYQTNVDDFVFRRPYTDLRDGCTYSVPERLELA